MSKTWYYVQGSERVGPVEESEIAGLFGNGTLKSDSYVWTKGYDNWVKAEEVDDLAGYLSSDAPTEEAAISMSAEPEPVQETQAPSSEVAHSEIWDLGEDDQVITIKVGYDRGGDEIEYGPYSVSQMRRAFTENRINGKTFVFVPGADNWSFLADTPLFNRITTELPPTIEEQERRVHVRKPFVARLLFHDQSKVYEGICRDISVGGLQILVSDYPAKIGDYIKMNVHPENDDVSFSASGRVVRVLDGNQGFSLRFDSLEEKARTSIEKYVQTHA